LKPLQQKAEEMKADSARKQKLGEGSPTEEDVDEISEEEISEEVIPDSHETNQSQGPEPQPSEQEEESEYEQTMESEDLEVK